MLPHLKNCQRRNLSLISPLCWHPSTREWLPMHNVHDNLEPVHDNGVCDNDNDLPESSFALPHSLTFPAHISNQKAITSFSLTTFNILFDREIREEYVLPTNFAHQRFEHAFRCLRQLNSDIICLQEVTQSFAEYLLTQDWIRSNYWISYDDKSECLQPFGQLTLSRFPMHRVFSYKFGELSLKRCLLVDFMVNNRHLVVANIHLPADHYRLIDDNLNDEPKLKRELNSRQRRGQLKRIVSLVQQTANDHFIAGDFNFGDNDELPESEFIEQSYLQDAWKSQHSLDQEPGFTLDTKENELSRSLCPTTAGPQRIDRILFSSDIWKLESINLVLTDKFSVGDAQKMHASDHYGVHAVFKIQM